MKRSSEPDLRRRRTQPSVAAAKKPDFIQIKGFSLGAVLLFAGVFVIRFFATSPSVGVVSGSADPSSVTLAMPWADLGFAILLFIISNGLYVAAETAIECMRPHFAKYYKDADELEKSRRLQKIIDRRSSFVSATTIGMQASKFLLVAMAFMGAPSIADSFGWQGMRGIFAGTLIIAIPLLILNLIVELVPKSFASLHPAKVGLALYRFITVSTIIFAVPAWLITAVANLLTGRFGGNASFALSNQAEEEIKTIVESAQETGEIEDEEREMLHSVFEFTDTVVREVMTPRVDIDALSVDSSPDQVLTMIKETGHSRIPLFEQTDDAIVGIVHAKDLLMAMLSDKPVKLQKLMRTPMFVPENKDLHDLLREMRQTRNQMAIVQDEFGGTSGLVTIEDIVEEVVGDIVDEYDQEVQEIVPTGSGWLVDGRTHVDDISKVTGFEAEDEEFDTIGGLVFGLFGRQPRKGESIEADGFKFEVADTDGRRILRVMIEKCAPTHSDAAAASD